MTEYMGNLSGKYDAKEAGFLPGYGSLHSCGTPHGPEAEVFEKMSKAELKPVKIPYENLAFMFESTLILKTTEFVMDDRVKVDHNYNKCWEGLKNLTLDTNKK